ncbi:hypothetical protein [Demequina sp.]|uniref:hypothetical protein n=1 Tax=Demequina sp. TaxID=2050685 RepID=UPI003D134EEB
MNAVVANSRRSARIAFIVITALVGTLFAGSVANADPTENFSSEGELSITGTLTVGSELSVVKPILTPAPTSDVITWVVGGVDAATGATYVLQGADLGKSVAVRYEASADGYVPFQATSAETDAVAKGTQSFTPVISGTAAYGYTLSVKGLPSGATFKYQWKRSGASISGATKSTYKATTKDIGKTITVTVTSTKTGYTTLAKTSAKTAAVKKVFSKAYAPVVSGTAKVGYKLTAKTTAWSPSATLKYQWYRNGVAIAGATSSSRTLSGSDAGATITVKVTGSRSGYLTKTVSSKATKVVAKGTISVKTPVLSGTKKAGYTLSLKLYTPTTSSTTRTIQWYRSGVAIPGATATTFALKNVDAGKSITVKVSYTKTGYTTKSFSLSAGTIAKRTASMVSGKLYTPEMPSSSPYYVGAGVYIADSATSACYWERGSVDDFEPYVGYEFPARWMVQIFSGEYFYSEGCGSWIKYDGTGAKATTITKTGLYRAGVDIATGVYQVSAGVDGCYLTWETDASQEDYALALERTVEDGDIVSIDATIPYFGMWGCGSMTKIGEFEDFPR